MKIERVNKRAIIGSMLCFLLCFSGCKKDATQGNNGAFIISGYFPDSGKGRTLVTIQGKGFSTVYDNNIVNFNGVKAEVLSVTEDELVVRAPDGGATGTIQVTVNGKSADAGLFTYQDLSISSVSPLRAASGSTVTIRGYGFAGVETPPIVTLNDSSAAIIWYSDSLIRVVVPASGVGAGPVKISLDHKQVSGPVFSYFKLIDFSPKFVLNDNPIAGTEITLIGSGFNPSLTGNKVIFSQSSTLDNGYDELQVKEANENKIVAVIPEGIIESRYLFVQSEGIDGLISLSSQPQFEVVEIPNIADIYNYGSLIMIKGVGFSPYDGKPTRVFIGDYEVPANYLQVYSASIYITVHPGMGTGTVKVITNGRTALGGGIPGG
ncbi:IPT/TIG domain-containing protein [bacterium A37T11]|nr:IPT/TIG domain-containing protein [bacterium A37T11]